MVVAGNWPKWLCHCNPTMNELEIAAIVNTVIVTELDNPTVDLYCDNTTAITGVAKGILRSYRDSAALQELAQVLHAKGWIIN